MSDIVKSISFIEEAEGSAKPQDEPVRADDIVLRRSDDPATPKRLRDEPYRPELDEDEGHGALLAIGIALALLTLIGIGAILLAALSAGSLGPWGWAALIVAAAIPAALVLTVFLLLRSLRDVRTEARRIARIGDRLTSVDTAIDGEVSTLAETLRREVALVDARLAEARDRFEGFGAVLQQGSRELDQTTKSVAERSDTVGRALTLHRQAFESLSTTFDAELDKLAARIETQSAALGETTARAAAEVERSRDAVEAAEARLRDGVEAASGSSRASEASLDAARERLDAMIARMQDSASELDAVYERRAEHLASLADRLSGERDGTQAALLAQTERLAAVDAQIEITEGRLTALVDHARTIHQGLMGQLSAIDATLDGADARSRDFTQALGTRVTDTVADARRELSLMEGELRALQSRLSGATEATLDLPEPDALPAQPPSRVHLKPLDTDFPSLEPPRAARRTSAPPAPPADEPLELDASEIAIPEPEPQPPAPAPDTGRDVVRRPGQDDMPSRRKSFGRAKDGADKGGWRWRDMLGGMDPLDGPEPVAAPAPAAPTVVRPPAGVPLAPPPAAPSLPDGSDVVARLCEVQLAPSDIITDDLLPAAAQRFGVQGEAGLADWVLAQRRDAVVHLRGVLAADLEFKLKAESFKRSYVGQLARLGGGSAVHAALGSASGRAYALCAAALQG